MNLLLGRKQSSSLFRLIPLSVGKATLFTLWAKTELSPEEDALLKRYNLRNAPLVLGDFFDDLRRSIRLGFAAGIIIGLSLFAFIGPPGATFWGVITMLCVAFAYYNEIRENIYVRDLLYGRRFRCRSIVDLVKKEAYLQLICNHLRQVLETAKHWDGREIIEIAPLSREEAKAEVLRAAA